MPSDFLKKQASAQKKLRQQRLSGERTYTPATINREYIDGKTYPVQKYQQAIEYRKMREPQLPKRVIDNNTYSQGYKDQALAMLRGAGNAAELNHVGSLSNAGRHFNPAPWAVEPEVDNRKYITGKNGEKLALPETETFIGNAKPGGRTVETDDIYLSDNEKQKLYEIEAAANEKRMNERLAKDVAYATDHPLMATAGYLAMEPIGAAMTPIATVQQKLEGRPLDINDPRMGFTRGSQAYQEGIQAGVRNAMNLQEGSFGAKTSDFLVGTGLSMLSSAERMAVSPLLGAIEAGLAAGSSAMIEAKQNGATDTQAITQGIAQGIAEELFEKFSLEQLDTLKNIPTTTWKQALKGMAKQGFFEGSEEVATEIANYITDYMIMGDKSQYNRTVEALMAQGMTFEEARRAAQIDFGKQVGMAGLGGFVSGIGLGTIGEGAAAVNFNSYGKRSGYNQDSFNNIANNTDVSRGYRFGNEVGQYGEDLRNLAREYADREANGGTVSNIEKGYLYNMNNQYNDLIGAAKDNAIASAKSEVQSQDESRAGAAMTSDAADAKAETNTALQALAEEKASGEYTATPDYRSSVRDALNAGDSYNMLAHDMYRIVQDENGQYKGVIEKATGESQRVEDPRYKAQFVSETDSFANREDAVNALLDEGDRLNWMQQDEAPANPTYDMATYDNQETPGTVDDLYEGFTSVLGKEGMDAYDALTEMRGDESAQFTRDFSNVYAAARYGRELSVEERASALGSMNDKEFKFAYDAGISDSKAEVAKTIKAVERVTKSWKNKKQGTVDMSGISKVALTNKQKTEIAVWNAILTKGFGLNVKWFNDVKKDGTLTNKEGSYTASSNTIEIGLHAGATTISSQVNISKVVAHELTHWMQTSNAAMYESYKNNVIQFLAKSLNVSEAELVGSELANLKKDGKKHTKEEAEHELVARASEDMMRGNKEITKLFDSLDANTKITLADHIKETFNKIKKMFNDLVNALPSGSREAKLLRENQEELERLQKQWTDTLLKGIDKDLIAEIQNGAKLAKPNDKSINTVSEDVAADHNSQEMSIRQMADAFGYDVLLNEDGIPYQMIDQKTGKKVTEVTEDMVSKTPIGNMIDLAVNNKNITTEVAKQQRQMFADLMNMVIKYNGAAEVWAFAGSTLFSSIKKNSDKQYGTTVDFGTICSKTQAIVDVMSKTMLEKGRGLTRAEVIKVYNHVANNGLSVPCPVCYVFSRWMGVPSLLETMRKCQVEYGEGASLEKVNNYVKYMERKYQKLADEKNVNKADDKKVTAKDVIGTEKTRIQGRVEAAQKKMQQMLNKDPNADISSIADEERRLQRELNELEAYNWVTQVRCKTDSKRNPIRDANGNIQLDEKYRDVPNEILLDMNRTGDFASKYAKSWTFRTTRGAGMGKAIMPYSGAVLGDTIKSASNSNTNRYAEGKNPFFNGDIKKAKDAITNARKRIKAQNLIGGQRFQSTSDYRAEWGLDYMMTFLEMQAIGAKGQLYTKVIEAVDLLASSGCEVNLSIMGKGKGWHVDANGNKVLDFSSITGIDYDQAYEKTKQYDNVQMILVGLNDEHIRLALEGDEIQFVIPWHSSGSSEKILGSLMSAVNETLENGTDYSDVQSDKEIDFSEEKKAMRALRKAIVMGKAKTLNADQQRTLDSNPWLQDLYNRFYVDKNSAEYGIKLNASQATQIFPYEYWDKSLTIDQADMNGYRFQEYCASLGISPRFSGAEVNGEIHGDFTNTPGYWKLLIDRRMYNRDGTYHEPSLIDVTGINIDSIPAAVNSNNYQDQNAIARAVSDSLNAISDTSNEMEAVDYGTENSNRDTGEYAPTFYSKMEKEIEGIKGDKIGAAGVESFLKGKGVKDEEIKWSGIRTFLEGKKSVTKQELLDYARANRLNIEEKVLDNRDSKTPEQQEMIDGLWNDYHGIAANLYDKISEAFPSFKEISLDRFINMSPEGMKRNVDRLVTNQTKEGIAGQQFEKAKQDVIGIIRTNDYFGFDTERQALSELNSSGENFFDMYEVDMIDTYYMKQYLEARNKYNEAKSSNDIDLSQFDSLMKELNSIKYTMEDVEADIRANDNLYKTQWHDYTLAGGENYREYLFTVPGSEYTNSAMRTHWEGTKGVLAHARVQDFTTPSGERVMFVEEIQSDWHNAGQKKGYRDKEFKDKNYYTSEINKLWSEYTESPVYESILQKYTEAYNGNDDVAENAAEMLVEGLTRNLKPITLSDIEQARVDELHERLISLKDNREKADANPKVPDAPFRSNYTDFVLKNLLRKAAEDGYDYLGWTTGKMQEDRWSDEFAEGYRIEYDQDIPKFLKKYGKQWGAGLTEVTLGEDYSGVPAIKITDDMRDSVLYEGQAEYSRRDIGYGWAYNEGIINDQIVAQAYNMLDSHRDGISKTTDGDLIIPTRTDALDGPQNKTLICEDSTDLNVKSVIEIFGGNPIEINHAESIIYEILQHFGIEEVPLRDFIGEEYFKIHSFDGYGYGVQGTRAGSEIKNSRSAARKAEVERNRRGIHFDDEGNVIENSNRSYELSDSWLIDDIGSLMAELEKDIDKPKTTRRVDKVNKRLKEIGLQFNGTKRAAFTDERIKKYLSGSYYASTDPKYAQAYITYMSPIDYLKLTAGGNMATLEDIESASDRYGDVDFDKLGNSDPIYLSVSEGKNGFKVVGHEGRHRMYMLGKAGFEAIPVLMFDSDTKYSKEHLDSTKLEAQKFYGTNLVSKARDVVVNDVVPFSSGNTDEIINKFGSGAAADVEYSNRNVDYDMPLVKLAAKYGAIPKGYKPLVDVTVPRKTSDNMNVRQFTRTVLESGIPNEDMSDDIKKAILDEALSYEPISDKASMDYAIRVIKHDGVDRAEKLWAAAANGRNFPSKNDIAIGEQLLKMYADQGNSQMVLKMTTEMASVGTQAGQVVQAFSMLKKLAQFNGPEGASATLVFVQKEVDKLNDEYETRFKGKKNIPHLEINKAFADEYLNATTEEEREAALGKIYQDLGNQVPSTIQDKLTQWRMLAMLGNPRTHIRNILGNAVFMPAIKMKNVIAQGIETAHGGEKTKSLTATRAQIDFAKSDFQAVKDSVTGGVQKADVRGKILENRKVFKTEVLNKLSAANSNALETEDRIFLEKHYVAALSQYMNANHIDPANIDQKTLNRARVYAINEAQKATYRDASAVASYLNQAKNIKGLGLFVEGVLPFKKTPINILKRGIEYSPVGLIKSLSAGSMELKKGNLTFNQWADDTAAGLSGTAIMALGMFLFAQGVLRGGLDDDDDKDLEKLEGKQNYAIELFGKSYTVDWATPVSMPLFVGAEMMKQLEQDHFSLGDALSAMELITEPMFNLSMLDGLNNTIEAVSYSEHKLTALGAEVIASFLGQFVPTIAGQFARTIDDTRRINYTDKNSELPKDALYFIEKTQNKIPVWSMQNDPYVDQWGREDTTDSILRRAFENFISPGYLNDIENNPLNDEIRRLNKETGENVNPKKVAKYFGQKEDRVDLTSREYHDYQQAVGTTSYNILSNMIDEDWYQKLSSDEQIELFSNVYKYANYVGRKNIQPEWEPTSDTWIKKCKTGFDDYKIPVDTFIRTRSVTNTFTADKNEKGNSIPGSKKAKVHDYIDSLNLNEAQKEYLKSVLE